ncbi:MAG: SDR family NAD(P)-dependent oxidoreductase [Anaerolineae bacterium]
MASTCWRTPSAATRRARRFTKATCERAGKGDRPERAPGLRDLRARGEGDGEAARAARSSSCWRSRDKGSAENGAYTASKAAAQRIMESMALELRDLNINVNAVLPSTIRMLPQNRADMPNADPPNG